MFRGRAVVARETRVTDDLPQNDAGPLARSAWQDIEFSEISQRVCRRDRALSYRRRRARLRRKLDRVVAGDVNPIDQLLDHQVLEAEDLRAHIVLRHRVDGQ